MDAIREQLFRGLSPSWLQFFSDTTFQNEINYILGTVDWHNCIPSIDKVFYAFRCTEPQDVKVVILGQDPYPNPNNAVGLSFSVPRDIPLGSIPGSLANVLKCLRNDYPGIRIEFADLTKWALSGVLLLNGSLTLKTGQYNVWTGFTTAVIRKLYTMNPKIVFVAWGNTAKDLLKEVPKCIRVEGIHPSNATGRTNEFINAKHFLWINYHLQSQGLEPIDFSLY